MAAVPSDLKREQIFSMAEKEMEYRVEMFNKLTHTCFKKCVDNKYKDSELNMGENSCIDRCVSKYWQYHALCSKLIWVCKQATDATRYKKVLVKLQECMQSWCRMRSCKVEKIHLNDHVRCAWEMVPFMC